MSHTTRSWPGAELRGRAGGADRPKTEFPEDIGLKAQAVLDEAIRCNSDQGWSAAEIDESVIGSYLKNLKIAASFILPKNKTLIESGFGPWGEIPIGLDTARKIFSERDNAVLIDEKFGRGVRGHLLTATDEQLMRLENVVHEPAQLALI